MWEIGLHSTRVGNFLPLKPQIPAGHGPAKRLSAGLPAAACSPVAPAVPGPPPLVSGPWPLLAALGYPPPSVREIADVNRMTSLSLLAYIKAYIPGTPAPKFLSKPRQLVTLDNSIANSYPPHSAPAAVPTCISSRLVRSSWAASRPRLTSCPRRPSARP